MSKHEKSQRQKDRTTTPAVEPPQPLAVFRAERPATPQGPNVLGLAVRLRTSGSAAARVLRQAAEEIEAATRQPYLAIEAGAEFDEDPSQLAMTVAQIVARLVADDDVIACQEFAHRLAATAVPQWALAASLTPAPGL